MDNIKIKEVSFEATHIAFLDKNNEVIAYIDGLGGEQTIMGEFKQICIDKIAHEKIGGFTETELDFSDISDEDWLKLKNCKKIYLDTMNEVL